MTSLRIIDPTPEETSIAIQLHAILQEAIKDQASDIHIEPGKNEYRIRFRVDGILSSGKTFSQKEAVRLITRIKLLAGLDIAEKRLPQDGRFNVAEWPNLSMRINTCPAIWGEKIVIRLQHMSDHSFAISDLGMTPKQQGYFSKKLEEPHGLIVVAGPTGSGKTQTLYAGLQHINNLQKNIITLEDPVEVELNTITQINLQPKIGLGFANMLRSVLRQDPDVIMVGEIRDRDTAAIAIQAASTGHLVLTTVHATSVAETILRFQGLGIAPKDLQQVSPLYISQRLVRCLCRFCKQRSAQQIDIFEAQGCHQCRGGYVKRIAIFELQAKTPNLTNHDLITKDHIQALWNAGWLKVKEGITSLDEIKRVLGSLS